MCREVLRCFNRSGSYIPAQFLRACEIYNVPTPYVSVIHPTSISHCLNIQGGPPIAQQQLSFVNNSIIAVKHASFSRNGEFPSGPGSYNQENHWLTRVQFLEIPQITLISNTRLATLNSTSRTHSCFRIPPGIFAFKQVPILLTQL